jgi:hypothetical protein
VKSSCCIVSWISLTVWGGSGSKLSVVVGFWVQGVVEGVVGKEQAGRQEREEGRHHDTMFGAERAAQHSTTEQLHNTLEAAMANHKIKEKINNDGWQFNYWRDN